eukprot:CAMPEP_0174368858 /NCGR_PEP_ID=MMETSP0811_2-20130205/90456_1 /TAXON_ID=73025 ORGANISM="Eutreptiella gymnastica-like, Strain CCMP1594" /NCGR_SAMPLE_ID=MMETSP0811_2 /ASSEMBLY_ACC=CAM_ASM_000667 /LENGTH=36 /DNA_ID= /DNA_START= /DNA_END= /DNA_ORIENTATION=
MHSVVPLDDAMACLSMVLCNMALIRLVRGTYHSTMG